MACSAGTVKLYPLLTGKRTVCILTENQNQVSFYPYVPHEISVLIELTLGHLCYRLTDVPPQPNSPSGNVFRVDRLSKLKLKSGIWVLPQSLTH